MANLLILRPANIAAITASRGAPSSANLLTADPKEVWVDTADGSVVNIDIDLGVVMPIDTVFLGYVSPPAAGAVWTITGGAATYTASTLKAAGALRAIDAAGQSPSLSHAVATFASQSVRYVRLALTQTASAGPLTAGVVMAGAAFTPAYNKEWGAGRRVIDTGSATGLPSGGFSTVEGARKRSYAWTLGDLSTDEVDALEAIALDRGETLPLLVVEDPAATTGQRNRIHYGLFQGLKQFDRRNPKQTRWEFTVEEWI
jgi:hypothetical protein